MFSRPPEVTFQTRNSTGPYNEASATMTTTTTLTSTTNREPHAAAAKPNPTEKTATTGTATPAEPLTTTTPATKTAGIATETATYKSAALNATNYRRTKTLTETREGAIPIATAAPTTPVTTALDVAHLRPPLKLGSYASSHRTKIGRWRTC